ncbi:MAG: SRPBCC family protein [Nocardiopsaceae bacterium]|nr:SRPBCC family protein [Nocardiopsaceae bacterium]
MFKLTMTVCIEAPPPAVWEALARLEDIQLWSRPVVSAVCEPGRERGVGAERACELVGGIKLRERWLLWDEGRSFTYEGIGLPGVEQARNTWTVVPHGEKTLLHTEAAVSLKGGWLSRLVEPVAKLQSKRLGRQSLGAFKFLVENGFTRTKLPARLPVPASC